MVRAMDTKRLAELMGEGDVDWVEVLVKGLRSGELPMDDICKLMDCGYLIYDPIRDHWIATPGLVISGSRVWEEYRQERDSEDRKELEARKSEYQCLVQRESLETAENFLRQGLLVVVSGRYKLTEKGEIRAGQWLWSEMTSRTRERWDDVSMNCADFDGVKVGREDDSRNNKVKKGGWKALHKKIMESLSSDERELLGLSSNRTLSGKAYLIKSLILKAAANERMVKHG